MGYFPVRYDSRVVIYKRKMFIRFATGDIIYDRRALATGKACFLHVLCSLLDEPVWYLPSSAK